MNAANVKTGTVHGAYALTGGDLAAMCGADAWKNGAPVFKSTDAAVTCKRCMKTIDRREAERKSMAIAPELLLRAMPVAHEATASEDHPTESDMITDDMPSHMNAITGTVDDGTGGIVTHGWHCGMCKLDSGSMWTVRALMVKDAHDHFCGRDFTPESLPVRVPGALLGEPTQCYCPNDSEWCPNCNGHESNELPGDIERAWDAENAAAERRDIESEYAAEIAEEIVSEIMTDDRLMHLTKKGVFVSQHYMNTMRRIASEREDARAEWRRYQGDVLTASGDGFKIIDDLIAAGKISFTVGDREKRRIRNTCRPSVLKGRKYKASKTR